LISLSSSREFDELIQLPNGLITLRDAASYITTLPYWFAESDLEGVAFESPVRGDCS
jgi:hypothetical protein